eukprot:12644946-Heterocapsa_arctica.AAC.1
MELSVVWGRGPTPEIPGLSRGASVNCLGTAGLGTRPNTGTLIPKDTAKPDLNREIPGKLSG